MLPSDSRTHGMGEDVDVSVSSRSTTDQLVNEEGKDGTECIELFPRTMTSNVHEKRNGSVSTESCCKKLKPNHPPEKLPMKVATVSETEASQFDLSTPEGQIAASKVANGGGRATITWIQAKRAARREYNRLNAARARERHKSLAEARDREVLELKAQVEKLTRVNQFLLSQLSGNLISAPNGALQSLVDPANATSPWLWAISAIAEASSALGNSSVPSPTLHPLLDSSLLSRLPQQQQQQQQNQTNSLSATPFAKSTDVRHPSQQELGETSLPPQNFPDAASINAAFLMNVIATLPHSQALPGKGILDLLLTLCKSQSPFMTADDINELRRMK
jgi:hypothetical protein